MKTLFLAAAAALSIGIGSAYAGGDDTYLTSPLSTQLPGQQASLASQPKPGDLAAPGIAPMHTFITRHSTGTWLYPPNANGGNNS